jgi:hypothetical protein
MTNRIEIKPMSTDELNLMRNPYIQMQLHFDNEPEQNEPDFNAFDDASIEHDHYLAGSRIDELPTLPAEISYHGFLYIRICRGLRSYVYHQTLGKETIGYEVFLIRIQSEVILCGKSYPARERWPKDEDFSKTAWSCWTLEEAMLKFNSLES